MPRNRLHRRRSLWPKVILLAIIFMGLYFPARLMLVWDKPNSESETRVALTIKPGSSLDTIARELYTKELVPDAWAFKVFTKWQGLGHKLQAGEYVLQRNLTFSEIIEHLMTGKNQEIKITIPEGFTIQQIDDLLTKKSLIEAGDFERCAATCTFSFRISNLEGNLFPSTYFINPKKFSNKDFIQRLYKNQQVQLTPYQKDIQASNRTLEQILIMASMIEREAFGDAFSEKAKIAGILWKRLDEKIHLGVDATTRYELNEWKRPLYTEDFQKDTPYNTRKRMGLPPTAISNPGLDAIKAAIYPESSPYYYYLHDRSGHIRYAKDLAGHNENKRQYLW